jgi:hypothetical protein
MTFLIGYEDLNQKKSHLFKMELFPKRKIYLLKVQEKKSRGLHSKRHKVIEKRKK